MKAFAGLMKKEFILSKFNILSWLIPIFIFFGFQMFFGIRSGESSFLLPLLFMLLPLHIFFLPLITWHSLRTEGTTQLWLYNPNSTYKLVGAKLLTGTVHQLISQILTVLLTILIFLLMDYQDFVSFYLSANTLKIFSVILLGSLYYAFWVLFLWTVYHSLANFPIIRHLRWLIVAAIFIVYQWLETYIKGLDIVSDFINSSPTLFNGLGGEEFLLSENTSLFYSFEPVPVVIPLYHLLLVIILFIASCWLLDKKVEVGNGKGI